MRNRIPYVIGACIALLSATAVIAGSGSLSPAAPACSPADRRTETVARARLLSGSQVAIAGNRLVTTGDGRELDVTACDEEPQDVMLRHLAVLPGVGAAYVEDRSGPDVLLRVGPHGTTPISTAGEVLHPVWSPSGRLAWSENMEVVKVMSADGAEVEAVALPKRAVTAFSPVFVDETRLAVVVQEKVAGAPPEDDTLNNLWALDLDSGTWTKKTSFRMSGGTWSAIRTPVVTPDGTIFFVRIVANADQTREPRFQLWRAGDGGVAKVKDLGGEMYLAGSDGDDLLWNAPSRACGDWGVFAERDGELEQLGCGSVMADPLSVLDPDALAEDDHGPGTEEEGAGDLVIVVGDFPSRRAAAAATSAFPSAGVVGHGDAPSLVRPEAYAALVEIPPGTGAERSLENVRAALGQCDCDAWLAPRP